MPPPKRFLDTLRERPTGASQRADQGGDTVGEGQAYGMLIAAAIGDEERFDSIWGWTKDNIQRPDGLLSFLWRDGKVADPQAASDADVDAARALLVASCRFKTPGYCATRRSTSARRSWPTRRPTSRARRCSWPARGPARPPITLNPSYFSPATFAALGDGDRRRPLGQPVRERRARSPTC